VTLAMVRISALVEDFSIYPRHAVDGTHVNRLTESVLAGEQLPPIVVDKPSLRVVDGFHRVRVYRRVLGPEADLQVDLREFAGHAALVSAAVEANTRHGKALDQIDRVRCAVLMRDAGIDQKQIALVLRVRPVVVDRLLVKVAVAPSGSGGTVPGTDAIALKQAAIHLSGQTLTREQVEVHGMLPGTSLTLLARQLCNALNTGFVDARNERLHDVLLELHQALERYLASQRTPAT
jgi:hypothetical protein